jgi:hypothetical protein
MNGRVTQVPRLVVIEPTEAVVRVTDVVRGVVIEPTEAVVRVTDVVRGVVIEPTDATIRTSMYARLVVIEEGTTTQAIVTQLSRLVVMPRPIPDLGERAFGYIIG